MLSQRWNLFVQEKLKHAGKEMTQENMKYIHVNVK